MEVSSAVDLINNLIYKPGWSIEAEDHTNRFESAVKVKITYPALRSEREMARLGYPEDMVTYASLPLIVADCDDISIYRGVLGGINGIDCHEAREFLRVAPTFWAPFHPHRIDGMKRWGDPASDLTFGIA